MKIVFCLLEFLLNLFLHPHVCIVGKVDLLCLHIQYIRGTCKFYINARYVVEQVPKTCQRSDEEYICRIISTNEQRRSSNTKECI